MKWSSHKKITGKIGKYFGVRDTKALNEASILPDKEYDYRIVKVKKHGKKYEKKVRLRHHLEPFIINKIIDYTIEARRWKVRNSKNYIIPLGKAAHYIQDNVIDPRKKILFFKVKDKKTHDKIESQIDKLNVPFEEVYKVEKMKFTLSDFEKELKRRKPTTDPEKAMKNATYLTAMLMKLVLKPEYPDNFWSKYRRIKIVTILGAFFGIGVISVGYIFSNPLIMLMGGSTTAAFLTNPLFWERRKDAKFLRGDL